jgi:hypothetical protein
MKKKVTPEQEEEKKNSVLYVCMTRQEEQHQIGILFCLFTKRCKLDYVQKSNR